MLLFGGLGIEPCDFALQEGLKKLNVLLDSNEFLQALDRNTMATPAAGKIKGPQSSVPQVLPPAICYLTASVRAWYLLQLGHGLAFA